MEYNQSDIDNTTVTDSLLTSYIAAVLLSNSTNGLELSRNTSFSPVPSSVYYAEYLPEKEYVGKYVTILTYIIGFPGNILALMIWLQKRMLNSSGYYLAALAFSDLMFLALQMFHEVNDTWNEGVLNRPFICEVYPLIFMTCQFLSPLLVLAFTVERYISICHPFKREKFCTTTRARLVILCLVVLCFFLNIIQSYFWYYDSINQVCTVRKNVLEGDDKSIWSIWTWFIETVVFMLVPLMILFFNMLVILEARRLAMYEKHQLKSHAKSHGNATTVMLIAVSFYHIFTTFPVTIAVAMFLSYNVSQEDSILLVNSTVPYLSDNSTYNLISPSALPEKWQSHFNYILAKSIIEEIGLTHYAFNFYIYFVTGKNFRQECKNLLCQNSQKPMPSWNTEYTCVKSESSHSPMTVRMVYGEETEQNGTT